MTNQIQTLERALKAEEARSEQVIPPMENERRCTFRSVASIAPVVDISLPLQRAL
jgi:hypothetical protein